MAVLGLRKQVAHKEAHEIRLLRQAIKKAKNFEIRKACRKLKQALDREKLPAGISPEAGSSGKATSTRHAPSSQKVQSQITALKALEVESTLRHVCAKLGLEVPAPQQPVNLLGSSGENAVQPGNLGSSLEKSQPAQEVDKRKDKDAAALAGGAGEGQKGGQVSVPEGWAEQRILGATCVQQVVAKVRVTVEASQQAARSDRAEVDNGDDENAIQEITTGKDATGDEPTHGGIHLENPSNKARKACLANSGEGEERVFESKKDSKENILQSRELKVVTMKGPDSNKIVPKAGKGGSKKRKELEQVEDALLETDNNGSSGSVPNLEGQHQTRKPKLPPPPLQLSPTPDLSLEKGRQDKTNKDRQKKARAGKTLFEEATEQGEDLEEEDDFFAPGSPSVVGQPLFQDLDPMELSDLEIEDGSESEEDVGSPGTVAANGSANGRKKSRSPAAGKQKKKSKNRLGQRERQRLAEKLYGRNAKHIKEGAPAVQGRSAQRRPATGNDRGRRPDKRMGGPAGAQTFPAGRHQASGKKWSQPIRSRGEGARAGPGFRASEGGGSSKRDAAAALHPSWAAKAAQSKQLALPGTGKKITFGD